MVLFFFGPNSFAIRQKVKELIERFTIKTGSNFGLERFDGSDQTLDINQVLGAITNLPLLGDSRLILVEDVLKNQQLTEAILGQINDLPKSTVLVLIDYKPDERTKLFKSLKEQTKSQKFTPLDEPGLIKWIEQTVTGLGGQIDKPTAQYLVERAGDDQWRIYNELLKLINFNTQISREIIDELVEPAFRNTIFDLLEAVTNQRLDKALDHYEGLRANKAEPLYVLSMLGWQLRNLLIAKAAEEANVPAGQAARDFKLNPYVINKATAVTRRLSLKSIKQAYSLLITCDYKLKTSAAQPDTLIQQLLGDIAKALA